MLLNLMTAAIVTMLVGGDLIAQQNQPLGTIEIMVMDTYGKSLKGSQISIVRVDEMAPATRFTLSGPGVVRAPYGEYLTTGTASLHQDFHRKVTLKEDHLLVFVAFAFRDPGTSSVVYTDLHGEVVGSKNLRQGVVVRAVGVWSAFSKEASVSENGGFVLREMPYGEYLLLALRGSELVASERFTRTVREERATIHLRPETRE
ncbi:hypothetical protein [Paludibaculum fermentans]|uniref:hypothetical protein n=1 Tax=Paludibaculum fermentans TaxID=1473598 RepID=UPI003EB976F9